MSPKSAVIIGNIWINLPILLSFGAMPLVIYNLSNGKSVNIEWIIVGLIISFVLSWFWWAVMITKWKLWAFSKVDNIQELNDRGIRRFCYFLKTIFLLKQCLNPNRIKLNGLN